MFRILSPTLSMSVLNLLSKHLGGLLHLPLRLVLTVTDRASCAGVSMAYGGSVQGGVVWIAVCLMRGVWTLSVCTMPHCVCALASDSLLGFVDVDDVMHKVSQSLLHSVPMSHSH